MHAKQDADPRALQPLCLALASDQAYLPGLLISAASAALHCDPQRDLEIHIFDGGIQDASWQRLQALLRRCHPRLSLQRLPLRDSPIFQVRDHGPGRELVYARLLIPERIAAPRVLYLDVDLLVLGDLAPLFDQPLGSHLAAACVDPIVRQLRADPPWPNAPVADPVAPYFNSGVLLIDADAWRHHAIAAEAFALLRQHSLTCRFRDQTVLNHLLQDRWLPLEPRWNTISRELRWCRHQGLGPQPLPTVLHFFDTPKPWAPCIQPQLAHRLWQRQARRLLGPSLLWQLPPLSRRQMLRSRLQELLSGEGRLRRQAMGQLLRG